MDSMSVANTPKNRDDMSHNLREVNEGLKLELEMWQKAFKEAQTKQANRVQLLLQEFNNRESRLQAENRENLEKVQESYKFKCHLI